MKKRMPIALIFVILTFFYFSFHYVNGKEVSALHELSVIGTILQRENINIEEWTIYAREKLDDFSNIEEVQAFSNELANNYPNWTWSITDERDSWSAEAHIEHPNGIIENIQILTARTNIHPQTYITYQIKGTEQPHGELKMIEKSIMEISDIFRYNATFFTCIVGKLNDKMNTTLPFTVNNILHLLEAKKVESMTEENFFAVSAYSHLLGEGITLGAKKMNLQLGIRTERLGAETTIVVGTPIITIEY